MNKEQHRQRTQAAMTQLEAEAAGEPDDDPEPPARRTKAEPASPEAHSKPADKTQLNFTDPQSKLMKTSGGFEQAHNCQAAVDSAPVLGRSTTVPRLNALPATRSLTGTGS